MAMAVCEVWHREPPRLAGTLRQSFSNGFFDLEAERSRRVAQLEKCRKIQARKSAEQFTWAKFSEISTSRQVYTERFYCYILTINLWRVFDEFDDMFAGA